MRSLVLVLVVVALSAACGSPPPPLDPAANSAESLARDVLSALGRGDEAMLKTLVLSADEFGRSVWPELPAARAERTLPMSYVWGDLRQKSDASLKRLLARYRGRAFELARVTFERGPAEYGTYTVHRGTMFVVREGTTPIELRACGSLIEKDGRWKVFSYLVDE